MRWVQYDSYLQRHLGTEHLDVGLAGELARHVRTEQPGGRGADAAARADKDDAAAPRRRIFGGRPEQRKELLCDPDLKQFHDIGLQAQVSTR